MLRLKALASSSFTGSDENPLSEGGVWATSLALAPFKRVSNAAEPTDLAGFDDSMRYTGVAFPGDQYARANLTVNSTAGGRQGVGLGVRMHPAVRSAYRFVIDHAASNNADISRFVAGAGVSLVQWTQAFTDGDQFTFVAEGETLSVYDKTMTLVKSYVDNTSSLVISGAPGIEVSTAVTSASIDNWEGGAVLLEVPSVIRRRQSKDGMFNDLNIKHWF